jgi:hypothetical protein
MWAHNREYGAASRRPPPLALHTANAERRKKRSMANEKI